MKQMEMTTSEPTRRGAGLAGRLLVAQSLVLMAGALTAWTIAATVGPSVFHEHLARANVGSTSAQIFHTEAAFQSANAISLLSLIHISEPTRLGMISYAVFCLKKK